jgi:hypothetical protein
VVQVVRAVFAKSKVRRAHAGLAEAIKKSAEKSAGSPSRPPVVSFATTRAPD